MQVEDTKMIEVSAHIASKNVHIDTNKYKYKSLFLMLVCVVWFMLFVRDEA